MINLYDGNNVMFRAMTTQVTPGQVKISLRQRLATASASDIWVWDGFDHNARRIAIYPPYKSNRPEMGEDLFSQIKLFKKLLALTPAVQITCPTWEADDVVATLATQGRKVVIHTNDFDYAQLRQFSNVTLLGVKGWEHDPSLIPLFKALSGDSSDRIAGIPGFGPKAWETILPHAAQITRAIVHGTPAGFFGLPFTPAVARWLTVDDNIKLLQSMLTVTYFQTVPDDEIAAGMTVGKPDPAAVDAVLRKYFL